MRALSSSVLCALLLACSGAESAREEPAPADPVAPAAAATPREVPPPADTPLPAEPPADPAPPAPFGSCDKGKKVAIGRVCVRPADGSRELAAGVPVEIVVEPAGCWSSSTRRHHYGCDVQRSGWRIDVLSQFCFVAAAGPSTPDCSGGGTATCGLRKGLREGTYEVRVEGRRYSLRVPSTVGAKGWCRGEDNALF